MILGMPSRSTGAVYQNEEPDVSDAFSSRVSSDSRASMSRLMRAAPFRGGVAGVGEHTLVLTTLTVHGQDDDAGQRSSLPSISPTIVTTPGS